MQDGVGGVLGVQVRCHGVDQHGRAGESGGFHDIQAIRRGGRDADDVDAIDAEVETAVAPDLRRGGRAVVAAQRDLIAPALEPDAAQDVGVRPHDQLVVVAFEHDGATAAAIEAALVGDDGVGAGAQRGADLAIGGDIVNRARRAAAHDAIVDDGARSDRYACAAVATERHGFAVIETRAALAAGDRRIDDDVASFEHHGIAAIARMAWRVAARAARDGAVQCQGSGLDGDARAAAAAAARSQHGEIGADLPCASRAARAARHFSARSDGHVGIFTPEDGDPSAPPGVIRPIGVAGGLAASIAADRVRIDDPFRGRDRGGGAARVRAACGVAPRADDAARVDGFQSAAFAALDEGVGHAPALHGVSPLAAAPLAGRGKRHVWQGHAGAQGEHEQRGVGEAMVGNGFFREDGSLHEHTQRLPDE
ncbi:hypothetical protein LMG1866_01652 [Achromobacter ruhlandii]|nr:hypothetical protein LMG1866_01652 [Achromobacter ruhlandii]